MMRDNMPFLQIKKIKTMVRFFGILFTVFVIAGCASKQGNQQNTSEQIESETSNPVAGNTDTHIKNRLINLVSVELENSDINIIIQGDGKLVYTSLRQSFPFGIAVYLPETKMAKDFKTIISENRSISDLVVHYADEEKTAVKVEILLNQDFDYKVIEIDNALKLTLLNGRKTAVVEDNNEIVQTSAPREKTNENIAQEEIIIPNETAIMTDIEFNAMVDGKSNIVVQTNHPVKYDITQENNSKLYLNLYNTIIPDYHKRPIITKYFKSAVQSLMPIQEPGTKKNAKIEIKIREQVPYRVVRGDNNILLFFEPATIDPPEFKQARKEVASGAQTQTQKLSTTNDAQLIDSSETSQIVTGNGNVAQEQMGESKQLNRSDKVVDDERLVFGLTGRKMEEKFLGRPKKFIGEKLRLNFFETDIKNVFRIFSSVGKFNFAIDDDVQGKVTLAFDHPVAWDQALYTVLRMNHLGMKKDGSITRIATMETLKQEEIALTDAIQAAQKRLAAETVSEPQITEYFSINYSGAANIAPHIEEILTVDDKTINRKAGVVSVAEFTNMLIVTDTKAKIDQAREIIHHLDKVIPQIMVEAKIIEATRNFSKALGVGLAFGLDGAANDPQNNIKSDLSMAIDKSAVASLGQGAVSFAKIAGADFLTLNAKIAASEITGDLKVISSPRILIMDNEEASIEQGLQVGYQVIKDGEISIEFLEIPLKLKITPHVSPDQRILMDIYVTKKDIDSVVGGVPSLFNTTVETKLLVNNMDTIVIGGIVKSTKRKERYGLPFLSDVPVLGHLFRTDTNFDKKDELLIFITPTIVQLDQKRGGFVPQNQ